MHKDNHNGISCKRAISPVSVADNTAQVSQIIDTAGFESLEFVFAWGSLADVDATFTVLIEDGADSGLNDAAAVDDSFLYGTEVGAAPLFSSDNTVSKIGYHGPKRYVRATVTPAANSSAALMSCVAILGAARKNPYTTQLQ